MAATAQPVDSSDIDDPGLTAGLFFKIVNNAIKGKNHMCS